MTCNCSEVDNCFCDFRGYICTNKGDDILLVFSVHEDTCDGALFDISGASEIVFVVADENGGVVRIDKRMSTGGVSLSTNGYQFSVALTDADTLSVVNRLSYYECYVTSSDGKDVKVSCGLFKAETTTIPGII